MVNYSMTAPDPAQNRSFLERPLFHLALMALLGIIVYSNTFAVPFQYDEEVLIEENPVIKDLRYFLNPQEAAHLKEYGIFKRRFVSFLTFAMNYRLGGLDVVGYHAFNLAVHILNAFLVYALATLTLGARCFEDSLLRKHPAFFAFFPAMIFICHPVQTEAVTYIMQRFASLAAFFYLASLVLYARWKFIASPDRKVRAALYILSLSSAFLASRTKESALTLPFAFALYEFIFFRGRALKRLFSLLPFFLPLALFPLLLIDTGMGGVIGMGSPVGGASVGLFDTDYLDMSGYRREYLITQIRVIVTYIRLLFLPINQNLDYDYPIYASLLQLEVMLSLIFLMSIFCLALLFLHRSKKGRPGLRLISFGILWFFIALSVESSIFPIPILIAEYRLYLPGIGVFIAFSAVSFSVLNRLGQLRLPRNFLILLLIVVIPLSAAAYKRNAVWKDDITLWTDTIGKSPGKSRPYHNLGTAYAKRGELILAGSLFQRALSIEPGSPESRRGMALTYVGLGNEYSDADDPDAAVKMYEAAMQLDPSVAGIYFNLGVVYERQGDIAGAIWQYEKALSLDPAYEHPRERLDLLKAPEP